MNLRQLRFFVTVAEELHFGRAADRLCMTQPPLSQAILALEQELKVDLFKRTKRHVELTPFGRHLLPHAMRLLADADELPAIARQLARGACGSLRLGFVTSADYNLLPGLVSRYSADFPDVKVTLSEMTSDVQMDALMQGEIDAGLIIPLHQTLHPSLEYSRLISEPLFAAVPEQWITSGRIIPIGGKLLARDLAELLVILFPRKVSPAFHDIITSYFVRNGIAPETGQEAVQMQTIVSLVSAGMGVALVPGSLKNLARSGVRYLELAGEPPLIETGIVWRRDEVSPTVAQFIEIAKSAVADYDAQDFAGGMAGGFSEGEGTQMSNGYASGLAPALTGSLPGALG